MTCQSNKPSIKTMANGTGHEPIGEANPLGIFWGNFGFPLETHLPKLPNKPQPAWKRSTNSNEKVTRERLGNFGKLWETLVFLGKATKTKVFQKIPTNPDQKQTHLDNWAKYVRHTVLQLFLSMPTSVCRYICVCIALCVFMCVYTTHARFCPNVQLDAAV